MNDLGRAGLQNIGTKNEEKIFVSRLFGFLSFWCLIK